jgi:hypothetical protein
LHNATASLAVPKSVINTIVGRADAPPAPLSPGVLLHAPQNTDAARTKIAKNRMRDAIESPKRNEFL